MSLNSDEGIDFMEKTKKKENQWKIDRGFSFNDGNEKRIYEMLKLLGRIKTDSISEKGAIQYAEKCGLFTERGSGGFEQSTATLYRNFGLLTEEHYVTTEIADRYTNNEITYKELVLMQLIRKENQYDEKSEVIHPVVVLIRIMLKIWAVDPNLAWFDAYDYFEYLTEVKSEADVDNIASLIIDSHRNELGDRDVEVINDFDIWREALVSTGLFKIKEVCVKKKALNKYTINEEEIALLRLIASADLPCERLKTGDGEQGKTYKGIIPFIPILEIQKSNKLNLPNGFKVNEKEVLEAYLFEGLSPQAIETKLLGNSVSQGAIASLVCNSYGVDISDKNQGIWKEFARYKNLVRLSMLGNGQKQRSTKLFTTLFSPSSNYLVPNANRYKYGVNKIYYGIPGCGKSYYVSNTILKDVPKENIVRTTFYLDYTYTDFVGQLLPKTDGTNVTYEPNFGPFSKALKKAYETDKMVYLVIEEINRGNAAAIFGDLFQLLDRIDDKKVEDRNDGTVAGDSEYPISNSFIEDYLSIEPGKVIIPSNLSIVATMNTSDQNVFPLDTAFKRRWNRIRITPNWSDVSFREKCIPYTDFTWEHFVISINELIDGEKAKGTISEDKKLGPFFIGESYLADKDCRHFKSYENDEKWAAFTNNVVDYLYNDVTQFDHTILFEEEYSYEKVYDAMMKVPTKQLQDRIMAFLSIFANQIKGNVVDYYPQNDTGNIDGVDDGENKSSENS